MTKPSIPGHWLPADPAMEGKRGKQSLRGDPDLKPQRERHSFGAGGEQTKTGLESTLAQLTEPRGLDHISGASVQLHTCD